MERLLKEQEHSVSKTIGYGVISSVIGAIVVALFSVIAVWVWDSALKPTLDATEGLTNAFVIYSFLVFIAGIMLGVIFCLFFTNYQVKRSLKILERKHAQELENIQATHDQDLNQANNQAAKIQKQIDHVLTNRELQVKSLEERMKNIEQTKDAEIGQLRAKLDFKNKENDIAYAQLGQTLERVADLEMQLDEDTRKLKSLSPQQAQCVWNIYARNGLIHALENDPSLEIMSSRRDVFFIGYRQPNGTYRVQLTPEWNRLMNDRWDAFLELFGLDRPPVFE